MVTPCLTELMVLGLCLATYPRPVRDDGSRSNTPNRGPSSGSIKLGAFWKSMSIEDPCSRSPNQPWRNFDKLDPGARDADAIVIM